MPEVTVESPVPIAGVGRVAGDGGCTSAGSPGVLRLGRCGAPPILSILSPVFAQSRRNATRRVPGWLSSGTSEFPTEGCPFGLRPFNAHWYSQQVWGRLASRPLSLRKGQRGSRHSSLLERR